VLARLTFPAPPWRRQEFCPPVATPTSCINAPEAAACRKQRRYVRPLYLMMTGCKQEKGEGEEEEAKEEEEDVQVLQYSQLARIHLALDRTALDSTGM